MEIDSSNAPTRQGTSAMPTLLHLDSSPRRGSVSRQISGEFAEAWRKTNPDGSYVYRDLAANPVPHVSADGYLAGRALPSS